MKTTEKSTEVRAFSVTQECGYMSCDGNYKSLDLFHKHKAMHIHECTGCGELKLFNKEYPRLEYEEIVEKTTPPSGPKIDMFDDDIPF